MSSTRPSPTDHKENQLSLSITHTQAEGTVVEGDPRPHHKALKDAGFKWSRNIGTEGAWYLPGSRFKAPKRHLINQATTGLQAAGLEVTVDLDERPVDPAEREEFLAASATERAERLAARAAKLRAQASAGLQQAEDMASIIPLGQPVLTDHYSAKRDVKYRVKVRRKMDKAVETHREAKETERKADAAVANQAHREDLGTTLRRIDGLEAEQRDIGRKLTPCVTSGKKMRPEAAGAVITCPACFRDQTVGEDLAFPPHGAATGEYAEQLTSRAVEIDAELAYWRGHVEGLEAEGAKIWGPADFEPGDRVNNGCTVVRVNKKSLTVRHDVFPGGHTNTLPYNKVKSVEKKGVEVA
jgi:ferredoxin-thioredoxin reductase catalytic subunit